MNDVLALHVAVTDLRAALVAWLDDLVPPYVDEVLIDLEELTAQPSGDRDALRSLVAEVENTMEMLPSIPLEWQGVRSAAVAAGLAAQP